jgi:hypothetical protein
VRCVSLCGALKNRDTVAVDTPAASATVSIVTSAGRGVRLMSLRDAVFFFTDLPLAFGGASSPLAGGSASAYSGC